MNKIILVVDDAASIRQTLAFSLEDSGYNVIEACDGLDALDKLDGQVIDLIISDVNMPNMNGVEFLKKVKEDDAYSTYRFIPFIMLTTEAGAGMREEGKKAGARAWMVKPFKPEQLIDAVKKMIS